MCTHGQRLAADCLDPGIGIPGDRGYGWSFRVKKALISHNSRHGGAHARASNENIKQAVRNSAKPYGIRRKSYEIIWETVGDHMDKCGDHMETIENHRKTFSDHVETIGTHTKTMRHGMITIGIHMESARQSYANSGKSCSSHRRLRGNHRKTYRHPDTSKRKEVI